MKVFAISDLHLGANVDKPMDIFGPDWEGHTEKIAFNWNKTVGEDDLVLMPGDLSWAMRLEEAIDDLKFIESLPGHKVFIRGNHDYWFSGPGKVRKVLGAKLSFLRFDALEFGGVGLCGVRGQPWPGYSEYSEDEDGRLYRRELKRLELSIESLNKLRCKTACAMIHYPPLARGGQSEFCELFRRGGVKWVVYGHVHGHSHDGVVEGEFDDVNYVCASADQIHFTPKLLFSV